MDQSNVIVNYLPPYITETHLTEMLGKFGKIQSMKVRLAFGFLFVDCPRPDYWPFNGVWIC